MVNLPGDSGDKPHTTSEVYYADDCDCDSGTLIWGTKTFVYSHTYSDYFQITLSRHCPENVERSSRGALPGGAG